MTSGCPRPSQIKKALQRKAGGAAQAQRKKKSSGKKVDATSASLPPVAEDSDPGEPEAELEPLNSSALVDLIEAYGQSLPPEERAVFSADLDEAVGE